VNVRASYFDETREQVDGLWKTLGYKKIGVIYPEDAFGSAVLEGVKAALKQQGAETCRYRFVSAANGAGWWRDRHRARRESRCSRRRGTSQYSRSDPQAISRKGLEASVLDCSPSSAPMN